MTKVTPNIRFTLHWALSGLVEDHDYEHGGYTFHMIRKYHPYAILEPLKYLLPESYGGYDQDWMTIGPHRLSKDSILLVATSHQEKVNRREFPGTIEGFDPEKENLAGAVDRILTKKGAYVLKRTIPVKDYLVKITDANLNKISKNPLKGISKHDCRQMLQKAKQGNNLMFIRDENNIPIKVNGALYNSSFEFYKSLRDQGYFWGKYQDTLFRQFEKNIAPFLMRIKSFQVRRLFPDTPGDDMPLFGTNSRDMSDSGRDIAALMIDELKMLNNFANNEILGCPNIIQSENSRKALKLWILGLHLWVKNVVEPDNFGSPVFLPSIEDKEECLKNVINRLNQLSTTPMLKLFQDKDDGDANN